MKGRSGVRRSYIIKDFLGRPKLFLLAFASGIVLFYACLSATTVPAAFTVTRNITALVAKRPAEPCQYRHDAGFLTAVSSELVDASGCRVYLTGVNWFGFETSSFAPHGLGVRNWQDMLNQIAQSGFNTIRLPFSDQLFDPSSVPQGINYLLNPDLKRLQGLALMDKIIEGAHKVGLKVILDHHDASADERSGLWYNDQYPQSRWIDDWVMLAQHYRGNDTVIGADLDNEPHNPATWGDGNPYTDWRLAAEQAGDSILAANPDWLIIVQGIDVYQGDSYWWGGNLEGAAKHPVILSHPDKLVYSAHDYGPSVYDEQWFKVSNPSVLTHTLPAIWDKHWGYLQKDGIAPVFVGEFGGPSMGQDIEGVWQRTLISYLQSQGISYAYWAWNADSGDTGGIVNSDWKTVNQSKMNALSAYQWPLLGQP
ncbi:MAG TPA: glycoside hydrolase family 5 protein [Ktedonobacteraceae bacterium]|jgi:endoglucanase|nr:glycoside hydrolase family 5 protein [Ktedonobacteraceae bacterium]